MKTCHLIADGGTMKIKHCLDEARIAFWIDDDNALYAAAIYSAKRDLAFPAFSADGGINMPRAKAPKDEMTGKNATIVYFNFVQEGITPDFFFRCGP
jgi:hypothetical protein